MLGPLTPAVIIASIAAKLLKKSKTSPQKKEDIQKNVNEACDKSSTQKCKKRKNPTRRSVFISNQRRTHILYGDRTGGGHRPGLGKPGKSEFPKGMTDDQIIDTIIDVASDPTSITKPGRGGRIVVEGMRDGIDIRVILESDGSIVSGFPKNTPRNIRK